MPINCTLTYKHLANDTEDTSGDIGTIPAIGPVYAEAQFADDAAALGSDATGYTIRRFKGYLDTDGILKNKPGGTVGMRVWANDPLFNLARLPYTVTFDLYDALGRRIALNGTTFDAPSTDTTVPLSNVLPIPGAMAAGIQRRSSYAEDIIDVGVTGHALVIAETPAEAWTALGGGGSPGAGITDVVQDTTPQLGGNLDLNGFSVGLATAADLLKLHAMTATGTELNFVDGVTSPIQTQLDGKVDENAPITGATKTKLTYDAKGLVTAGADAAVADITGLTAALTAKEATANKGAANGYAPLDASSLVPAVNLPSYVDDVLEFANLAALPASGTTGKIYVTLDTNKTYRWSGSAYVEISPSPGSTDSVTEGSANLYYTQSRADARVVAGITAKADKATTVSAGTGLTGGGDLSANRTLAVAYGTSSTTACVGDDARLAVQTTVSGNAGSATVLATARTINGVSFNGSANITIPVPSDFMLVQVGNVARAVGSGDFAVGHYVGRAFTVTKVVYQFDTVDASGSTTVELRRNGTQVASSSVAVTAANQVDGTGTDAARSVTVNQSFSVGDRISLQITAVGTTPGKGLRAWVVGTWN